MRPVGWDAQRRAHELIARREALLRQLPGRVRDAARLSEDVRELIVDDAIEFVALRYRPSVASVPELERVFWDACIKRVARAKENRYATVRAGYARADLGALDTLTDGTSPEDEVLAQLELRLALEFAAMLAPTERAVWATKHTATGAKPLGYKQTARRLGLPVSVVRAAEREIEHKRQRFAAIHAAGRLCAWRAPAVAALAAGDASALEATAARAHLQECSSCKAAYVRHLRYLRSARFSGKVAALLPAPATERPRSGVRDLIADWAARALGHDPASTATQLAATGAGRGLATAAAAKLAALCLAGAGTLGACLATGLLPTNSHRPHAHAATATSAAPSPTATPREPPLRRAGLAATPAATPTPRHRRRASETRTVSTSATAGATGPTSHERAPASPAPANAAANGASEFDPAYQPTGPTRPASVPAAPGGNEFP